MDLESSKDTDGSGVAADMLDLRHPPLGTRLAEGARGLGQQIGDTISNMSRRRKVAVVTLIIGAAAAAWRGPRAVASLRARNASQSRLPWRR